MKGGKQRGEDCRGMAPSIWTCHEVGHMIPFMPTYLVTNTLYF